MYHNILYVLLISLLLLKKIMLPSSNVTSALIKLLFVSNRLCWAEKQVRKGKVMRSSLYHFKS